MNYSIISGEIRPGVLYRVNGEQSVNYNTIIYNPGQSFRGLYDVKDFVFTGEGTQYLNEVVEFYGNAIEYIEAIDWPVGPLLNQILHGASIEFSLNEEEKRVNEKTNIQGFSLMLLDYPFYSFEIVETKQ